MTIEEAIRILDPETSKEALRHYDYDSHQRCKAVDEACRAAVNELRKHQWISVEDRLPDKELQEAIDSGSAYLGLDDNCIEVLVVISKANVVTTLYYDGICFYDQNDELYSVTHWRELPEPPESNVEEQV